MAIKGLKKFNSFLEENLSEKKEIKNNFKGYSKNEVSDELIPAKYFDSNDLLEKAMKEMKETKATDFISYGYNFLDNHLGGINKKDLVIIGGETGTGKTLFANNIALKASKHHRVAVWSLEDDPLSILKQRVYNKINELRVKNNQTRYPFLAYWKNEIKTKEFYNLRQEATELVSKEIGGNLFYVDSQQTLTIALLEKEIERQSKMGIELMLIDHLHKFNFKSQGDGSKADLIEEFMNRLRKAQDKTGMRIILIVHFLKLNGAKPILDSFKDSISIPQNASVVINLWRDRGDSEENKTNHTLILIPKIRIPVPEITFTAEFNLETNDYNDDAFVFGTEQGDAYKKAKEVESKKQMSNRLS